MATKKDYIAIEDSMAAAMIANLQMDVTGKSLMDIILLAQSNLVTEVAKGLAAVNPAFNIEQFGDAITQRMRDLV